MSTTEDLDITSTGDGATTTMTVVGEIDVNTCGQLQDALVAAIGQHVALDLTGVGFIDSSGLRSVISGQRQITEAGGVLSGKVVKIADATKQDAKCDECADDRKGKPVLGMEILRGLKKGEGDTWEGGTIIDPNNGKVYKATIKPIEGGAKLQMRGYIGPFYRTQIWVKAQ